MRALREIWEQRASLADDLGPFAPDPEAGRALLERVIEARDLGREARALAAYAAQQEALANHAVMTSLRSVIADVEHVARTSSSRVRVARSVG